MACLSSTPSSFCCCYSTLPRRLQSVGLRSSCHSWSAAQAKGLGEGSVFVLKRAFRVLCSQATSQASNHSEEPSESATGLATLEQFIQLNVGSWSGTFTQYDVMGNVLQRIPTRLSATSYGNGENISLVQTLHIKEATSKSRTSDEGNEPVWQEFKLGDTNLFTMEQRQQIGFFPGENAYAVSHQTSEMLDNVLRIGVLGEDDDGEEFPKGVKLPSRRPALVCESCVYSQDAQKRVRAFHVLDPRGFLDVIGVFHESRDDDSSFAESQRDLADEPSKRIEALLGRWSGQLVTRRTGIYGSTLAQCNVQVCYQRDEEAKMNLEIKTDRFQGTRIAMNGASLGAIMRFEGGLLTTMLPGGLALTCPGSVGQSVGRKQAFYFELSWIESPGRRRRLVRTFDTDGLVVSTSLATESKLSL